MHLPRIHAPTTVHMLIVIFYLKKKNQGLDFTKTIVVAIELLATTASNDFTARALRPNTVASWFPELFSPSTLYYALCTPFSV